MAEAESSGSAAMSEYERQRLENIAKNNVVLESLGLTGGGQGLLGKNSSTPAFRAAREKKERPVFERRERVQRNIKQPERLDPGAERLRKAAELEAKRQLREAAAREEARQARAAANASRRAKMATVVPTTPSASGECSFELGVSDALVYVHFHGPKPPIPPRTRGSAKALELIEGADEPSTSAPHPEDAASPPKAETDPAASMAAEKEYEDEQSRGPPQVDERIELFYDDVQEWFWGRVLRVERLRKGGKADPDPNGVRCTMLMDAVGEWDESEDGPFNMTTTTWRREKVAEESSESEEEEGEAEETDDDADEECEACQGAHRKHTCRRVTGGGKRPVRKRGESGESSDEGSEEEEGEEEEGEEEAEIAEFLHLVEGEEESPTEPNEEQTTRETVAAAPAPPPASGLPVCPVCASESVATPGPSLSTRKYFACTDSTCGHTWGLNTCRTCGLLSRGHVCGGKWLGEVQAGAPRGSLVDVAEEASAEGRSKRAAGSGALVCPHGHRLTSSNEASEALLCDGTCGRSLPAGELVFSCATCDYDVCADCCDAGEAPGATGGAESPCDRAERSLDIAASAVADETDDDDVDVVDADDDEDADAVDETHDDDRVVDSDDDEAEDDGASVAVAPEALEAVRADAPSADGERADGERTDAAARAAAPPSAAAAAAAGEDAADAGATVAAPAFVFDAAASRLTAVSAIRTQTLDLLAPAYIKEDRRVEFVHRGSHYLVALPRHVRPRARMRVQITLQPQIELEAPLAASTVDEYVANARRAARLKRRHTELRRSGVLPRLAAEAEAVEAAAKEAAAEAYEVAPPEERRVFWMHPPHEIPAGRPADGWRSKYPPAREWEWVAMDGLEEPAEAGEKAEAEVKAHVKRSEEEDAQAMIRSWLPKEGSLRGFVIEAMREGISDREGLYAYVRDQPGTHRSMNRTTLRSSVVTLLGKEKGLKVPLFYQDDTEYPLTREGCLALGVDEGEIGSGGAPKPKREAVARPPPPADWVWPKEGERVEVEVEAGEGEPTVWVTALIKTVLVDGSFGARIEMPDASDSWDDWFTWQEEGIDWKRREKGAKPPPKGWKWVSEGDRVEVEITAEEGDGTPTSWVSAVVLAVLIDGTFQARILMADEAEQWEDWFSWEEEGTDWRRAAVKFEEDTNPASSWQRHLAAAERMDVRPASAAQVFESLQQRVTTMRHVREDGDDEIDGWYVKVRFRKGSHKHGDVRIVDPLDGESFASLAAVRRKLGLEDDHAAGGAKAGTTGSASTQLGMSAQTIPAPPAGWVWPQEGEWIEVEVEVEQGRRTEWVPAHVLSVHVDGRFRAQIELPDGTDQWEDWFSWEDEGTDWRRRQAVKSGRKRKDEGGRGSAHGASPDEGPKRARVATSAGASGAATGVGSASTRREKTKTSAAPWPRAPLGGPPLTVGEEAAVGMMVEVVQYEDGLLGSRFVADVLEFRGKAKSREAHVQYHALFEDDGQGGGDILLREWVKASALVPPVPRPPASWSKRVKPGDKTEAFHEGGWWQVIVHARVKGGFDVEASGYGVRRTVLERDLRPP